MFGTKKMEDLKKVCAVIDMQGYIFDKKFYPRELCICNDTFEMSIEIDSYLDWKNMLKSKHKLNYSFQKYLIHGIPLESIRTKLGMKVHKAENLNELLIKIYEQVKTSEKNLIACKNQQVATILSKIKIPHLNLEQKTIEEELCPALESLDKKFGNGQVWFCPLHTALSDEPAVRKTMRCSLRKSRYIWAWICAKLIMDGLNQGLDTLKFVDSAK